MQQIEEYNFMIDHAVGLADHCMKQMKIEDNIKFLNAALTNLIKVTSPDERRRAFIMATDISEELFKDVEEIIVPVLPIVHTDIDLDEQVNG